MATETAAARVPIPCRLEVTQYRLSKNWWADIVYPWDEADPDQDEGPLYSWSAGDQESEAAARAAAADAACRLGLVVVTEERDTL